jgi:hypothetical protein
MLPLSGFDIALAAPCYLEGNACIRAGCIGEMKADMAQD